MHDAGEEGKTRVNKVEDGGHQKEGNVEVVIILFGMFWCFEIDFLKQIFFQVVLFHTLNGVQGDPSGWWHILLTLINDLGDLWVQ